VPVDARIAAGVRGARDVPALPEGTEPLWDGERPTSLAGWIAGCVLAYLYAKALGALLPFELPIEGMKTALAHCSV